MRIVGRGMLFVAVLAGLLAAGVARADNNPNGMAFRAVGWFKGKGNITLEIINLGALNVLLYPKMQICQLILDEVVGVPLPKESQFHGQTRPSGGKRSPAPSCSPRPGRTSARRSGPRTPRSR